MHWVSICVLLSVCVLLVARPIGTYGVSDGFFHSIRLKPREDITEALNVLVQERNIVAGHIISGSGSFIEASIRFANQTNYTNLKGPLEIGSISGTVSKFGNHLHVTVADSLGRAFGGHIQFGCKVFTTVELLVIELKKLEYKRVVDPDTTFKELFIEQK